MKVAPSLLSANFLNLEKDIRMIETAKADLIHYDIMDGVFVPNISFGFPILKQICANTYVPVDIHLMTVKPENFISLARDCGSYSMTIHIETVTHLHRVIQLIREAGMKVGLALNPATPLITLEEIIGDIDKVLLMSVNPGFGGQKFIENTLSKIRRLKKIINLSESKVEIEIDGGVNALTAPLLAEAGADILVSGSYIFKSKNPVEEIIKLKML